ncbi:hypothetical protein Moror_13471 [Moniliophthora roreri MCA 2997]|nr:hypothetical protein Moror_13471 [Moniliophthora roreri MCA 2997]
MLTEPSIPISNSSTSFMQMPGFPQALLLANRAPTPMLPRTLIQNPTMQSVWDNDDLKELSSNKPLTSLNKTRDITDEVYEYLSALCAEWRSTMATNAQSTVVKYAGRLCLVTSLEIVISDKGQIELLKNTIPSTQDLLTMIATGVTSTLNSMETASSNSTAAQENVEDKYKWQYTEQQESFRQVTLSDGTVVTLEYHL